MKGKQPEMGQPKKENHNNYKTLKIKLHSWSPLFQIGK